MLAYIHAFFTVLTFASFARATISITPLTFLGNSTYTITWTFAPEDPTSFDIELIHSSFNTQFALGNNVPTASGTFSGQLPVVPPADDYSLEFVNTGNINAIIAQVGPLSVVQHDAGSPLPSTVPPTTAPLSTAVPSTSSKSSSTISTIVQSVPTTSIAAPIPSSTTPLASISSASSSTPSSSSPRPTSGAGSLVPHGSLAALVAGALALAF